MKSKVPSRKFREIRCDIGTKVRLLRAGANISQSELGRVLRLGQAAISRIEKGEQSLAAEEVYVLARFFEVSPEEIVSRELSFIEPGSTGNRSN
ncbi:MAG: helix-turn-helix transcriptional regulator [Bdellovibrionota bacterium]